MRKTAAIFAAWGALAGAQALAQLPSTDLHTISQAFAKAGETIEITVTGEHLEEVTGLRFNEARITAAPVRSAPDDFFPAGQVSKNRFAVTIPAAVAPGIYEVRSLGHFGLSTARPFMVLPADATEVVETGDISKRQTAQALPIETGVRGQVDGQRIDWYRIDGKKGERLLIEVWAERLDSKLDGRLIVTDAEGRELESNQMHFGRDPFVDFTPPADGAYYVGLSDVLYRGGGGQYFYRLKVSRRPHVDFVFPPAGLPGQVTRFTLYGRNLPGGSPGEGISLDGKPLDTLEVDIPVPAEPSTVGTFTSDTPRQSILPAFEYAHAGANPVRIGFATAPVVLEKADAAPAQTVTLPCEIAGRFDDEGDSDTYRFTAKKGSTYWIETISERFTANADTVLLLRKVVRDDKGVETLAPVAENDDPTSFFSVNNQDSTHADSNDAVLSFTADADAEMDLKVINNLASGGIAHRYRLAIREASPDFQLLTATEQDLTATNGRAGYPTAPLVRRGGSFVYRVLAPRRDGFDGDIVVTIGGLPAGVTASPLVLSGDTQSGFLTVTAAADAPAWTGPVTISGKATIGGREVVRVSRNASLVWGVIFADSVRVRTRLDLETVLSVTDRETAPALIAQADPAKTWQVELNGKLEIPVKLTDHGTRKGVVTVQPHGFPGLHRSPPSITLAEGAQEGVLPIEFKPGGNFEVKPGRYQFVLQGISLAKYRYNLPAVEAAAAEKTRLEKLTQDFEKKVAEAKAKVAEAQKALGTAKANAATATEAAKSDLAKQAEAAQAALAAAQKAVTDAEAKVKRGKDLVTAADSLLQAVTTKAKETDTKFGTYSQPISVEVTEPAAKKP